MRLIHRREMWVPTIQGWIVTLLFFAALMLYLLTHIHSFLAPNHPIKADILVVEGWVPDYALKNAIEEFKSDSYQKLITTGIPLEEGSYLSQYKNIADLAAASLRALNFDQNKLVAVPVSKATINRTAATAIAVRQWLADSSFKEVASINLQSFDVHTRRSWLIYKQAFAPDIKVGVISVNSHEYNPDKWWASSQGVRLIMSETIAYIYAKLFSWRA